MPSRTIRPTETPEPAPFAYTIGTTEGLAAESVFAQWDGSGASGAFLPCVSYYSAEGVLLDRAFPDGVTLAIGATAEVSYRPFKRGGGGAQLETTDGATVVKPTTELFIFAGLEMDPSGPGTAVISALLGLNNAVAHWSAAVNTNGVARPLTVDTAANIDLFGGNALVVNEDGYYLLMIDGTITQPAPAGAGTPLTVQLVCAPHGADVTATVPADTALPGPGGVARTLSAVSVVFLPTAERVQAFVGNGGAGGAANTTTAGGKVALCRLF